VREHGDEFSSSVITQPHDSEQDQASAFATSGTQHGLSAGHNWLNVS